MLQGRRACARDRSARAWCNVEQIPRLVTGSRDAPRASRDNNVAQSGGVISSSESTTKTHEAVEATNSYIKWNEQAFLQKRELPLVMTSPESGTLPIICDKGQIVRLK